MSEHFYRCAICGMTKTISASESALYTVPYCQWCVTTMLRIPEGAQPYRIDEVDYE